MHVLVGSRLGGGTYETSFIALNFKHTSYSSMFCILFVCRVHSSPLAKVRKKNYNSSRVRDAWSECLQHSCLTGDLSHVACIQGVWIQPGQLSLERARER